MTNTRKKSKKNPRPRPGLPEPGDDAPYWLPTGSLWHDLSPAIKKAVHQILVPLWKRIVLEAQDDLEQAAGATLVHLMWLELCDQAHIGAVVGTRDSIVAIRANPDAMVARHLNLVSAKNQTWALLARQRMAREVLARVDGSLPPPRTSGPPALPLITDRQSIAALDVPNRPSPHAAPADSRQDDHWPSIPFTPVEHTHDNQAKT
ncbi:MAG: hypothetical protein GXY83_20140 [Rhodopirellula sp.]|nr:hypothetical protein [Rhodopirellula sp.]